MEWGGGGGEGVLHPLPPLPLVFNYSKEALGGGGSGTHFVCVRTLHTPSVCPSVRVHNAARMWSREGDYAVSIGDSGTLTTVAGTIPLPVLRLINNNAYKYPARKRA